ncbi:MAG: energy transducer TonB [Bacteroidota bacterium]
MKTLKTCLSFLLFAFFCQQLTAQSSSPQLAVLDTITENRAPQIISTPAVLPAYLADRKAKLPRRYGNIKTWLPNQLKYPQLAREYGIEGRVVIRCIISAKGKVTEAKVVKGIGFGCDEAAVTALEEGPKWSPARLNGKAVATVCYVPVDFSLQ